ncbi:GNAT family N-acetyltransferase [Microbaculum sp. FT89]|uniref:GNAT family N-acetyltransferase n=1 Tax=Microbaculum sp. FT89 TaxID=3447298 RepID=UPI003F533CB1
MTAPLETEIRTERLLLRPLAASDAPAIERLAGDERVARLTARLPHPYPAGAAEDFIAMTLGQARADAGRWFAITRQDEPDALLGVIGLEADDAGTVEIGYWLGVPAWGQGLMSEAVPTVVSFARQWRPGARIAAHTFPENVASQRVLEKAGFRRDGVGVCEAPARDCRTVRNAPLFVFAPDETA